MLLTAMETSHSSILSQIISKLQGVETESPRSRVGFFLAEKEALEFEEAMLEYIEGY